MGEYTCIQDGKKNCCEHTDQGFYGCYQNENKITFYVMDRYYFKWIEMVGLK
jgi:hypothetical protein